MLVQAGATGARPAQVSGSTPTPTCSAHFHVAFVTDVAGLRSATDAAGWRGVRAAAATDPCLQAELISSTHPTDYRQNLQLAADRHSNLIIAASFLLADPAVEAAVANPSTHFLLVDPLVATSGPSNLAVITFREDEAGFLAGALAGLTTRSGIVAGVYALEDEHDRRLRLGFERGAHHVNASVHVLGVYQGALDGSPYANPEWGAAQARAFVEQGADVIFGSGDLTGQGALSAATDAGKACITVGLSVDASASRCLVGTVVLHVDRAVAVVTADAAAGRWQGGDRSYGVAEGAIELHLSPTSSLPPDARHRLEVTADLLANSTL